MARCLERRRAPFLRLARPALLAEAGASHTLHASLGDVQTLRRYRLQLGALVVGVAVTLLATTTPLVPFAFRSSSADLVLETSTALAAGLTAYLVLLRFRENKLASDLFLAYPLALFALTHLAVSGFSTSRAKLRTPSAPGRPSPPPSSAPSSSLRRRTSRDAR